VRWRPLSLLVFCTQGNMWANSANSICQTSRPTMHHR
jgi:hypothetical protein